MHAQWQVELASYRSPALVQSCLVCSFNWIRVGRLKTQIILNLISYWTSEVFLIFIRVD